VRRAEHHGTERRGVVTKRGIASPVMSIELRCGAPRVRFYIITCIRHGKDAVTQDITRVALLVALRCSRLSSIDRMVDWDLALAPRDI
jgi:hypothetical protein